VWHIVYVSGLFLVAVFGVHSYALDRGYPVELARTMAVNTLVVLELFHLFFVRNIYGTSLTLRGFRGTPAVWICVGTLVLMQGAFTYLPAMHTLFGTVAVPVREAIVILGIGVVFFAFVEVEKQIRLALGGR
jgi:magnesium-transporting ATPase (P-type)